LAKDTVAFIALLLPEDAAAPVQQVNLSDQQSHAAQVFQKNIAGNSVHTSQRYVCRRRDDRVGRYLADRRLRRYQHWRLLPDHPQWLVPDFSALVPTTARERVLFALVALSAGICEEIVYRAWLLDVLHRAIGLGGFTLVGIAAVVFGLDHYYQGIAGILITSLLGLVFCGLYFASGTLLVPIVIHVAVDLRVALLPSAPSTAA
jgi:hypothetical protein